MPICADFAAQKWQTMTIRNLLAGVAVGLAAFLPSAETAKAYPIDCAILLCLAGGFPASAECSAARTEMMRRVTPWPIEPPLQLWRCPMGGGNLSEKGASDRFPAVIARHRDAIEVWQLSKHVTNGSGGRDLYLSMSRYGYDPSGAFVRRSVNISEVPVWLDEEVRHRTRVPLASEYGRGFRSIVLRTQDHTGAYSTEWVSW